MLNISFNLLNPEEMGFHRKVERLKVTRVFLPPFFSLLSYAFHFESHLFNKYLLGTSSVPGTALDVLPELMGAGVHRALCRKVSSLPEKGQEDTGPSQRVCLLTGACPPDF